MNSELSTALKDLGLSSTEAEIYVALLENARQGPITAYRLAQVVGRDPANLTKTIGQMTRRGAVTATGKRPRLYAPVPPEEFLGDLVARVEAKRQEAVALLDDLGPAPTDDRPREVTSAPELIERARLLVAEAERVVLLHIAPEWLGELTPALERAGTEQGAVVLTRTTSVHASPGPWLRLVVDGRASIAGVGRPGGDALLHGQWSRNPAQAFLAHRELGLEMVLDDMMELLRGGASADLVRRKAEDQWTLLEHQVGWKKRWQQAGLAGYRPNSGEDEDIPASEVAAAMAAVAAESGPEPTPQATSAPPVSTPNPEFQPETPGQPEAAPRPRAAEAAAGEADDDDDSGPLKFIFRRKRRE